MSSHSQKTYTIMHVLNACKTYILLIYISMRLRTDTG